MSVERLGHRDNMGAEALANVIQVLEVVGGGREAQGLAAELT